MKGMKKAAAKKTTRKAGIQPGSKKFPKILAIPASQEEILAAHKITPAELRHAIRIVDRVTKRRSSTAK